MSVPIAFVNSSLRTGGAEQLRYTTLKELARRRIRCRVCLFRDEGDLIAPVRELGIPVDILGVSGKMTSLRTTLALAGWLRRIRPSIVHGGQFLTNIHTTLATRLAGVSPVVLEEHGHNRWKKRHHRMLDRLICSRADAVTCCSGSVRDVARSSIRREAGYFHVLHNCVEESRISQVTSDARREIRSEFGIAPSELVVGTVGTIRPQKGHEVLLDAWRELTISRSGSPARLLIVGDGLLRRKLQDRAADLPGVIWTGLRRDVGRLLAAMDIFAFPSVDEGLGIALLEAMAAGLPCVASDDGGIPEVLRHETTGLLSISGNARSFRQGLQRLIDSDDLRKHLGSRARDYALQNHSPQVFCDRLLELHQQLLAGSRTRQKLSSQVTSPGSDHARRAA